MSDFIVHINMAIPSDLHFTLNIPELVALRLGLSQIIDAITHVGDRMSEAADALTAAVQSVQSGFDTLNTTLQTEISEIANALSSASTDDALHTAANDAVARLSTLATNIAEMNTTIQGIIP